jgi:drug/metabolite transporter (DMT)-like permease
MTALALGLVLLAAVLHATWNLCAKRAGGGPAFVWLVGVFICVLYVPVLLAYTWQNPWTLSWGDIFWIAGSGVLKTGYSLYLQRSYRTGDFSLVYPLARGTGPLLAMLGAVTLLGERPSLLGVAGGCIIVGAVFVLTDGAKLFRKDQAHLRGAIHAGLITGLFIAAYTLWDREGVHTRRIPPLVYDAGTALLVLGFVTPAALASWPDVVRHWREHKRYALGMAVLSPIAYVLVLTAMTFTPVSYVAPAREVSIVVGAFLGAKILKETDARRRLWAAAAMAMGVIALALG